MIATWPLDFELLEDGSFKPKDQGLWDAVIEWSKQTMGGEVHPEFYLRSWVAVEILDVHGDAYRVIGVTSVWNIPDCPVFHIDAGEGKENMRMAHEARDAMIQRLRFFFQDKGFNKRTVLVFVAEGAQRYWRRFLLQIGAKKADRYEVKI